MILLQATQHVQPGINPQVFQIIMFVASVIFGIIGYLITSNIKQMKTEAKDKNETQDNRLNSHSDELKKLNESVVKNSSELKANKENDENSRIFFKELLEALLKPIHQDLLDLKAKIK